MTAATCSQIGSVSERTLFVAFELSAKHWKLAMSSGFGIDPWIRTVAAGDVSGVRRTLAHARQRFQRPADAVVVSGYEAGRDGFWIHRALTELGVRNRVVDSASIEVSRRARRVKTGPGRRGEIGSDADPGGQRGTGRVARGAGADTPP